MDTAGRRPETSEERLERARETFSRDLFATRQCGAVVEEARAGHAVCSMQVRPEHRNAMGGVMGGAVYTLADFAGAVASNLDQPACVSVSNEIQYVSSTHGDRLVATADEERAGRRMCFYTIRVEDGEGRLVALMHATSMRV